MCSSAWRRLTSRTRPQFGQPNGGMLRAQTGTINRAGEPRRVQFGLKYLF